VLNAVNRRIKMQTVQHFKSPFEPIAYAFDTPFVLWRYNKNFPEFFINISSRAFFSFYSNAYR